MLLQLAGWRLGEKQFNAASVLSQGCTPKPQKQRHRLRTSISLQYPSFIFSLLLEFPKKKKLTLTGFINSQSKCRERSAVVSGLHCTHFRGAEQLRKRFRLHRLLTGGAWLPGLLPPPMPRRWAERQKPQGMCYLH